MSITEQAAVEAARIASFALEQNRVVNVGYYFYPAGSRDDAPTTWPTVAKAWKACRALHNRGN